MKVSEGTVKLAPSFSASLLAPFLNPLTVQGPKKGFFVLAAALRSDVPSAGAKLRPQPRCTRGPRHCHSTRVSMLSSAQFLKTQYNSLSHVTAIHSHVAHVHHVTAIHSTAIHSTRVSRFVALHVSLKRPIPQNVNSLSPSLSSAPLAASIHPMILQ